MKCEYDAELLSRYLERDLSADDMNAVAAHLEECLACCKEMERLRTAMKIMKSAAPVEAPRDYAKALRIEMHDKDLRN